LDDATGSVRKAISGFTLKTGNRVTIDGLNPADDSNSSVYDGTYVGDWEYTDSGDLDDCNRITIDRQYGYYVTDSYPWVPACFKGPPHEFFNKNGGPAPAGDTITGTMPSGTIEENCPEPGTLLYFNLRVEVC